MIFDYVTLKIIWWLFITVLLIGFAITGGMDLGVGVLLPFVGKTDDERRLVLNSIGPTWEGNQVWFVTAGGAIFAAWPLVYATAFSSFYFALLLVLLALILRPPGIDYRSKLTAATWRSVWDWSLFFSGVVPALVFGVAIGNLFLGIPFGFDNEMRVENDTGFFSLLSPFALLFGIVSLSMLVVQGGIFLQLKLTGEASARAKNIATIFGGILIIAFVLAGLWTSYGIDGQRLVASPDINTSFAPTEKVVAVAKQLWLHNYLQYSYLWLVPVFAMLSMLLAIFYARLEHPGKAILCSSLGITNIVFTAALALFPFVLPSSSNPDCGLTIWDAVSSHKTLQLMFWAVVIFLPIVLAYTCWVYRVMRGKVTVQATLTSSESY